MRKVQKITFSFLRNWSGALIAVALVAGVTFAQRNSGNFQQQELQDLDWLFRQRPTESPDSRIVIVGLEESDIQAFETYDLVVSDRVLAELLTKIKSQHPRVIGLDVFRDKPVGLGFQRLTEIFRSTPNLYGIEKALGQKVAPNPIFKVTKRSTASDVIPDSDRVLRRTILYPLVPEDKGLQGLGLAVALAHLEKEGIKPNFSDKGWLQIKGVEFPLFEATDGGYNHVDAGSYQMLINYRNASFARVSFSDILENKISPNQLRDKIVLIGNMAESKKDFFYTPYSEQKNGSKPLPIYGVEVQAHITSQIISAVLDERPLIKVWADPYENLWIFGWIALPALAVWQLRNMGNAGIFLLVVTGSTAVLSIFLVATATLVFKSGWWIPLSPALIGLIASTGVTVIGVFTAKHISYHFHLEKMVRQRTQELEDKNQQLQTTQEQLIAEKKLAFLGEIVLGVAHEIRNPLSLANNFTDLSFDLEQELQELVESQAEIFEPNDFVEFNQKIFQAFEFLQSIKQQIKRADQIVHNLLGQAPLKTKERQLINVNSFLVEAYKAVYYSKLDYQRIQLITNLDETVSELFLFSDIYQVFINLIDNAYDALEEKKEKLGEAFTPTLTLTTKNLATQIEIIFEDNGDGIPLEIKEKIFDSFATTKPSGKGTGLGLAIAHDIVSKHGGELRMETEITEYTKFTIVLPINKF